DPELSDFVLSAGLADLNGLDELRTYIDANEVSGGHDSKRISPFGVMSRKSRNGGPGGPYSTIRAARPSAIAAWVGLSCNSCWESRGSSSSKYCRGFQRLTGFWTVRSRVSGRPMVLEAPPVM